jgi:hypothetical protein
MGCSSCNERGEVLLVCPCGDTFSPQRGTVEQHYDEKHAEEGCCPWKSRGCTNCAQVKPRSLLRLKFELTRNVQDIKAHIRDKHCLTYFTCSTCLRSDFSCERSMKKHSKACKKQDVGFVFCGQCKTAWSSRAALVMHAAFCVTEWATPQ